MDVMEGKCMCILEQAFNPRENLTMRNVTQQHSAAGSADTCRDESAASGGTRYQLPRHTFNTEDHEQYMRFQLGLPWFGLVWFGFSLHSIA